MTVRVYAAKTAKRSTDMTVAASTLSTLMDAVDTAITDALAETDIDASLTAEAAVGLIQDAADAQRAQIEAQLLDSSRPVVVMLNGTPTQNPIREAFAQILKTIGQSAEYPRA